MAFGIEVRNNASSLLLSTDYTHYSFLGRFYVSPYTPGNNVWNGIPYYMYYKNIWYCDVTAVNRPLIMVHLPYNSAGFGFMVPGLAILSVTQINAVTWRVFILASAGLTIPYPCVLAFIHSKDKGIGTDSHGMRLFNADGTLNFDSSNLPFIAEGGIAGHSIAVPYAYNTSNGSWFYGYSTTLPTGVSPSYGTYFTGNVARVSNASSASWYYPEYWADAQLFPLFSARDNVVYCNYTPVLMNTDYSTYNPSYPAGTICTNGSYWYTKREGPQGDTIWQKVLLAKKTAYP